MAKKFDWENLGNSVASGIKEFFETWDAGLTGKTFSTFVKGISKALTASLNELRNNDTFEVMGQKIVDFICGVDWGGMLWDLGNLYFALAKAAVEFPLDLARGIAQGIVNKILGTEDLKITMPKWFDSLFENLMLVSNPIAHTASIMSNILRFDKWYKEDVKPWFEEEKWRELGQNILVGIGSKWEEFKSWWNTAGISAWWGENVLPWFTIEKWYTLGQGIFDGIMLKWGEFTIWWGEAALVTWWEESVTPWFAIEKWYEIANGIKEGITTKWTETTVTWEANILTWWNTNVAPWFTKKKWSDMLNVIPIVFKDSFKSAANGAIEFLNGVLSGIESMVNNAVQALMKLAETVSKIPGVDLSFEMPKLTLPRIPQFEAGGFPDKGSLFIANEAGAELVGNIGGRTAVAPHDEITGIADAVYSTGQTEADLLGAAVSLLRIIAEKETVVFPDRREMIQWLDEGRARNGYPLNVT